VRACGHVVSYLAHPQNTQPSHERKEIKLGQDGRRGNRERINGTESLRKEERESRKKRGGEKKKEPEKEVKGEKGEKRKRR